MKANAAMTEYYEQLKGCVVVETEFEPFEGDPWNILPLLTFQKPDGTNLYVSVHSGPEGNGPGFLDIL